MAITFIDSDIGGNTAGNDTTFSINTGIVQVGDTIVAFGSYPSGGDPGWVGPSDTTGWTELTSASRPGLPAGSAQAGSVHTIWVKKFTGSVPSSIVFTNRGGTSSRAMAVQYGVWRGLDDTTAVYTTSYDTSGTVTSINHPSVTVPGSGNGLVILAGHWDNSDIAAARTYGSGAFTEREYLNHDDTATSAFTNTQYMASDETVSAGSTGAIAFSFGAGNNAAKVLLSVAIAETAATGVELDVEPGSLVLAGQNITFTTSGNATLPVDVGSLSLTGQEIPFQLIVNEGTPAQLTLQGQNITFTLESDVSLIVDAGALVLSGQDLTFITTTGARMHVVAGQLTLTGQNISLELTGDYDLPDWINSGMYGSHVFKITKVGTVSESGRTRWTNYIPVKRIVSSDVQANLYDNAGAIAVTFVSTSGLTEWVDYIPVVEVSDDDAGKWRTDNSGFIPVVEII